MRAELEALISENKLGLADKMVRDELAAMNEEANPKEFCEQLQAVARVAVLRGRIPEALKQLRRAAEIRARVFGTQNSEYGATMHSIGDLLIHTGRYQEGEAALTQAMEAMEAELGPNDPKLAATLSNLGGLWIRNGAMFKGEKMIERAVQNVGAEGRHTAEGARLLSVLAQAQAMLNHPDTAATAREALATLKATLGEAHPEYQIVHNLLETLSERPDPPPDYAGQLGMGSNLMRNGRDGHAIEVLKSVCDQAVTAGKAAPEAWAQGMLATLYLRQNDPKASLAAANRAIELASEIVQPEALHQFEAIRDQALKAVQETEKT